MDVHARSLACFLEDGYCLDAIMERRGPTDCNEEEEDGGGGGVGHYLDERRVLDLGVGCVAQDVVVVVYFVV
jgi:hypothetical protein